VAGIRVLATLHCLQRLLLLVNAGFLFQPNCWLCGHIVLSSGTLKWSRINRKRVEPWLLVGWRECEDVGQSMLVELALHRINKSKDKMNCMKIFNKKILAYCKFIKRVLGTFTIHTHTHTHTQQQQLH
jgi:hypothetical protein